MPVNLSNVLPTLLTDDAKLLTLAFAPFIALAKGAVVADRTMFSPDRLLAMSPVPLLNNAPGRNLVADAHRLPTRPLLGRGIRLAPEVDCEVTLA